MNEPSDGNHAARDDERERERAARAWRASKEHAARSKEGVVAALRDARDGRLDPPAQHEHARRLLFGLTAPFTLLRMAWRDVATRRALLARVGVPVLIMGAAFATGIVWMARGLAESRNRPELLASSIREETDDDDDTDSDDDGDERAARAARRAKEREHARQTAEAAKSAALDAIAAKRSWGDTAASAIAAASAAANEGPVRGIERVRGHAFAAKVEGRTVWRLFGRAIESRLAKIIASLGVLEWILVWIVREHHDAIANEMSAKIGVPFEPMAAPPRLRFDLGWLKLKAWRAIRFLIFIAVGTPPMWIVGGIPVIGPALAALWQGAWIAYWACVFAIANSLMAWEPPPGAREPWFVRALRTPAAWPIIGLPFRFYAWVLVKVTGRVGPACIAFEDAPWESMGLALARVVAGVPGLYLLVRPMFAPAATHALLARRATIACE